MKSISINTVPVAFMGFVALLMMGASFSFAYAANDDEEAIVGTPRISESKALAVAEKTYTGNGTFTDIELEMEHGVLVYAVEYTEKDGNEVDVKVDAKNGEVVVMESDKDELTNDDEGDDKDDDNDANQNKRMQTLINSLTQLIELLHKKALLS